MAVPDCQSPRARIVGGVLIAAFSAGALVLAQTQGTTVKSKTSQEALASKTPTVTLAPTQYRTSTDRSFKRGGNVFNDLMADAFTLDRPPADAIFAGYLHDTNGKDNLGTGYEARNEMYRGAIRFDAKAFAGHAIVKAVLSLRVHNTHVRGVHSNPDFWDHVTSCGTKVRAGTEAWWTTTDTIGATDPTVAVPGSPTSDKTVDVTAVVRTWISGPRADFGLVIQGDNEDMKAFTETICQTQFVHAGDGAPTLRVTYQR